MRENLERLLLSFSEHFGRLGGPAFRRRRTGGEFIAHLARFYLEKSRVCKSVVNNPRRVRFVAAYEICLVTGFSVSPPSSPRKKGPFFPFLLLSYSIYSFIALQPFPSSLKNSSIGISSLVASHSFRTCIMFFFLPFATISARSFISFSPMLASSHFISAFIACYQTFFFFFFYSIR